MPYQDTQEAYKTVKKKIASFERHWSGKLYDPILHCASQRLWQISHWLMEPKASLVWSCLDLITAGFQCVPSYNEQC